MTCYETKCNSFIATIYEIMKAKEYDQDAERVILLKPLNSQSRNMRIVYLITIIITIFLGLASRKWSLSLSPFVAQNAGDVLWAIMIYFGFRFLLVQKSTLTAILLSFLFSFSIEFSQLYQEDWINQIRATTLGALILGKGFLIEDLIRYTVGILIAAVLDKVSLKFTLRSYELNNQRTKNWLE